MNGYLTSLDAGREMGLKQESLARFRGAGCPLMGPKSSPEAAEVQPVIFLHGQRNSCQTRSNWNVYFYSVNATDSYKF